MKINITGGIGYDFTAETLREKLNGHTGDFELHINSPGGDIYDGIEIYNEVMRYRRETGSKVTAYFSGFVASAASYLSMAASERIAYDNSVFMIHNASMIAVGDNRVFQFWADDLKKTDKVIARAYAKVSGKTDEEIISLMESGENNNGTYLYGEEIKTAGFADKVIDSEDGGDKENKTKESKILFANFQKTAKAKEYDHDRIVALVRRLNELDGLNLDSLYESAAETSDTYVYNNPYPTEHSARIKDPDSFQEGGFRRIKLPGSQVIAIIGKLKGESSTTIQAYRFPIEYFTEAESRQWLKDNDIEYITFEPATGKETNSREADKGESMSKKIEALDILKVFKENGQLTLKEAAAHLGLESQVISEEQQKNLSAFGKVKSLCGDSDPIEFINGLISERKENAKAVRKAMLTEEFGPEKHPETGKENKVRTYASKMLEGKELTEEAIKELKEDSIYKGLKAEQADISSEWNRIEKKDNELDSGTGPVRVIV